MKVSQAGFWLVELLFLAHHAWAHKAARSTIAGQARDHGNLGLNDIRKGAAVRTHELLNSIQHAGKREKRAQSDITWEVTPFNPTSIPLAVRR